MQPEWTVIIPVKALDRAKSRLVGDGRDSSSAAFAFFQDALAAAHASDSVRLVVVATSDPAVASWAAGQGAVVVDDSTAEGINGAAVVASQRVGVQARVAVVVSDLPSLTPAALDGVLSLAATRETSFVRDASGTGTTIWATTAGPVMSRFGPDSAAAHAAAGAADLVALGDPTELAPARRDVDTPDDLDAARTLGVGSYTAALLGGPLLVTVAEETVVGPEAVVPVVDESGRWHDVTGAALAAAGFRLVRVGQRLVIESGNARLP